MSLVASATQFERSANPKRAASEGHEGAPGSPEKKSRVTCECAIGIHHCAKPDASPRCKVRNCENPADSGECMWVMDSTGKLVEDRAVCKRCWEKAKENKCDACDDRMDIPWARHGDLAYCPSCADPVMGRACNGFRVLVAYLFQFLGVTKEVWERFSEEDRQTCEMGARRLDVSGDPEHCRRLADFLLDLRDKVCFGSDDDAADEELSAREEAAYARHHLEEHETDKWCPMCAAAAIGTKVLMVDIDIGEEYVFHPDFPNEHVEDIKELCKRAFDKIEVGCSGTKDDTGVILIE